MKSKYWVLFFLVFSIVSCQDKEFLNEFSEEEEILQNDFDFEEEDELDDHGHEHSSEGQLTLYQIQGTDLSKIKDFEVENNLLSYQQDIQKHFDMWNFVTRLIPADERTRLVEFEVFYGGGDLLGYVAPIDQSDLSRWKFALAIDAAERLEEINFQDLFTYVTIHEFGHVLTLNESQLNAAAHSCSNFDTGEGCASENAYINRLFELGWADIYDEFRSLDEEDLGEFYEKYQDRFVSEYAATNPGEDIAEVFSFFITEPEQRTGTSIADKKIQLLYSFPELVELRAKIRQSENVLGLRAGSWVSNPLAKQFKLGHPHQN